MDLEFSGDRAIAALDDVLRATVEALDRVDIEHEPTDSLYIASSHMLDDIVSGKGVMDLRRFVSTVEAIAESDSLRETASAMRKNRLALGLAARMRLDPNDVAVRRASTLWSAMMSGYYAGIRHTPLVYLPLHDVRLPDHLSARLAEIFYDIMGRSAPTTNPSRSDWKA